MTTLSQALAHITSTAAAETALSFEQMVSQAARFEWALLGGLEVAGIAPAGTQTAAALLAQDFSLTADEALAVQVQAASAGNLAIPLIKVMSARLEPISPEAAQYFHLGATSQDMLDTALVLQTMPLLEEFERGAAELAALAADLAEEHAGTLVAGRTWLQQGPPTTFGLKMAGYAASLADDLDLLRAAAARFRVLQFGGAVGTLAALRDKGLQVSAVMAQSLGLAETTLPWHARRERLNAVAAACGILVATLGKMARDLSLMMQTEAGEAAESSAPGKGGSSTMPHKRNPVGCAVVLAAAVRTPHLVATLLSCAVQEHERALGGWQAEWEVFPELLRLTAGALHTMQGVLRGLEVFPDRARANLALLGDLAMSESISAALAPLVGRSQSHAMIESAAKRAVQQRQSLATVLASMPEVTAHLSAASIQELLRPEHYTGSAGAMVERTVADVRKRIGQNA